MKCPKCGSTNVEELEIEIFESDMSNAVCEGADVFALVSLFKMAKNGYDKAKLSLINQKRYYCNKCETTFDK